MPGVFGLCSFLVSSERSLWTSNCPPSSQARVTSAKAASLGFPNESLTFFGNYPLKVNFVQHIADNVESCLCLLFVHHFFIYCIVCRLFVYLLCILFVLLSVLGPPEWGLALRDRCGAPFILSNLISSSFRPLERQNKKKQN